MEQTGAILWWNMFALFQGEPASTVAKIVGLETNDGTLGLAIAFAASTVLVIIFLSCYVHHRRKHQ